MRIKRLYLKGYANIYNALGRLDIEIDFSKCKHDIVVIRSENGSGKSSIINELHPFFSPSIIWLPDVEVQKTIEFYLEDGSDLSITYYGWRAVNTKSKPSRCYIQRMVNGVSTEYNPTGNINSAKDYICTLFCINDDYLDLAAISANSSGIGAMRPSERKKFVSLIIDSIEPFANMYKIFTSKYSIVKHMISDINAKISQIGNIEVIKATMEKAIHELQILNAKEAELIKERAEIKAKIDLLSNNGSPLEKYHSLLEEKLAVGNNINNVSQDVLNFSETELTESEKEQVRLQTKIESLDKILKDFIEQENMLKQQIEEDTIALDSIYNQDILEDTKHKLEEAKKELNIYTSRFEALGFHDYDNITEEEYILAVDTIEKFNNNISYLANQYSRDELLEVSKYINDSPPMINCDELIDSLQLKLNNVKDRIKEQQRLEEQSKSYNEIPIDCSHKHDCPFIISIVKANESKLPSEQLQQLYGERDELIRLIEDTKIRLQKQNRLTKCIYQVRELVNLILSMSRLLLKFPHTEKIKNVKHIIDCITNVTYLDLNIDQYREYKNYITLISSIKGDILSYEEKINVMNNHIKESFIMKRNIEDKTNHLQAIRQQKMTYLAEFNTLKNKKIDIDMFISTAVQIKCKKLQYEEELKKYNEINGILDTLTKDVEIFKSLEAEYAKLSTELNNLTLSNIPELQNVIDQSKYQMRLYEQYIIEYNQYSDLFNKLEAVRKYTGLHGIQADIMKYKMNMIIDEVNKLARMIFGGRFILKSFEINANDFTISVYDNELGVIRPDISMMSASQLTQLSMIISFVLLHNASKLFNIICLDEVDNNLDNDNRLRFFDLVTNIMSVLNFHQCILISHNTELDLTMCDLIITRIQNQESYKALLISGANIIADFNR